VGANQFEQLVARARPPACSTARYFGDDALHRLGYESVSDVRAGKLFRVEVDTDDPKAAKEAGEQMAGKLLANPVIEDYEVLLEAAGAPAGAVR